jgi:hypothetical protein
MFSEITADAYVMVDGDGTYDPTAAPKLLSLLFSEHLDMVVATRLASNRPELFRRGHRIGNHLLTSLARLLFGRGFDDMLSGYRIFSWRFAKSFPATSTGFEIETELSIHALQLKLPTAECETDYFARSANSPSKLNTYLDGLRILGLLFYMVKDLRPMLFFGSMALMLVALALGLGYPLVRTYYAIGLVPRLPTAILTTGLVLLSALSFVCGLILDSVVNGRIEQKRLAYLALSQRERN